MRKNGRANAGGLRYPDFLCIGAQKAGTTWLDHNLRRHPRLWLPPVKELQYFSHLYLRGARIWTTRHRVSAGSRALKRYIEGTPAGEWDVPFVARIADIASGEISDEWYGRIFGLAPRGRICGEITPDYATLPEEGVRHVAALSPGVKIILLMRDPIERSWSHIRMMMRTRRITDLAAIEQMARNPDQLRRADYTAIMDTWSRAIPPGRFHIAFADDISEKPADVLGGVCAFLGIAYRERYFRLADEAVHVGTPEPMPASVAAILKDRLRPVYEGIVAQCPERGTAWMARHYR